MSSPLLSLNCPNCGANLQISQDLPQFACSYCGATIAFAVIALSLAVSGDKPVATVILGLAAIAIAVLIYRSASSTEATDLKARLRERRLKLARNRRIADGSPSQLS